MLIKDNLPPVIDFKSLDDFYLAVILVHFINSLSLCGFVWLFKVTMKLQVTVTSGARKTCSDKKGLWKLIHPVTCIWVF